MLESLLTQNDFELMTSLQTCTENKTVQLLQLKHYCRTPIFNTYNQGFNSKASNVIVRNLEVLDINYMLNENKENFNLK